MSKKHVIKSTASIDEFQGPRIAALACGPEVEEGVRESLKRLPPEHGEVPLFVIEVMGDQITVSNDPATVELFRICREKGIDPSKLKPGDVVE